MSLVLRPIEPADVAAPGAICHDAFRAIAEQHNFPADFPDRDAATELLSELSTHPGVHGVVALLDGRVAGSNFVDERSAIVGLGPITVDPTVQNGGVGRALMQHMIDRATERGAPGLRLVQSGYHTRSLALYTKLGFAPREPLANLQGRPLGIAVPGSAVRPASVADAAACDRLCIAVHGHDRGRDLREAIGRSTAAVVERAGRITGYTTQIAFFGHGSARATTTSRR